MIKQKELNLPKFS